MHDDCHFYCGGDIYSTPRYKPIAWLLLDHCQSGHLLTLPRADMILRISLDESKKTLPGLKKALDLGQEKRLKKDATMDVGGAGIEVDAGAKKKKGGCCSKQPRYVRRQRWRHHQPVHDD